MKLIKCFILLCHNPREQRATTYWPAVRGGGSLGWRVLWASLLLVVILPGGGLAATFPLRCRVDGYLLELSNPVITGFDGDFVRVRLQGKLISKGRPRSGHLELRGLARSRSGEGKAELLSIKVTGFQISGASKPLLDKLFQAAEQQLRRGLILDRAALLGPKSRLMGQVPIRADGLMNIWPRILVSTGPAILIRVDGDPIMSPIPGTELQFVANTDWDIFFHTTVYRYFLRISRTWYESFSLVGPWTERRTPLPRGFDAIPKEHPRSHVRRFLNSRPMRADERPYVYVATEPATLILIQGEPRLQAIPGTRFSWVTNTQADLFVARDGILLLNEGRWFAARTLEGPWVGRGSLGPAELAGLGANHPKGHVRTHLPETKEHEEALRDAESVVILSMDRQHTFTLAFPEAPEKVAITRNLSYLRNAPQDILAFKDRYYCIRDGAWFVATSPKGPWVVSRAIPEEIARLPASCPVYHVRFCAILNYTPTTVTFAYSPGYEGRFFDGSGIVYGTGFSYPGKMLGAVYYGFPSLFERNRRYDPRTDSFVETAGLFGPFDALSMVMPHLPPLDRNAIWPKWGRVGFGPWQRRLQVPMPRPAAFGSACVEFSARPSTSAKRKPGWTASVAVERVPELFIGMDGQIYKRQPPEKGWWIRGGGNHEWAALEGVPRDVELQSMLTLRLQSGTAKEGPDEETPGQ